jgi:anaerobic selenocysteine-containing dehydrogenase
MLLRRTREMVEIVRSTCGICQIGCGILAHVDGGRVVRVEGDPDSPLNKGTLCPKGLASLEYLYHPDRLQHPLKRLGERGEGKWASISWDEALDTVAGELAKAKEKYGAESVAFIQGSFKGGTQGLHLLRFANLFGTPNCTYQGHVCFAPRLRASITTYGSYAIPDFEYPPSAIVVWGKNLAENLHHVYRRMMGAVERGAKLMFVNSSYVEGVDRADLWLKPRPGSDLMLAIGMLNVIIEEGLYDSDFVQNWTVGFDKLKAHVQDYTPERVADITWVPAEKIRQAARFYATNRPACLHWGNAIDYGVNSFQTARALCIMRAITGNLEAPGGDLRWLPVPVNPLSPEYTLPDKISPEMRQRSVSSKRRLLPGTIEIPPQDVIDAILTGKPYPIRAAYSLGCNPLLSYSNARKVYEALRTVDFLAMADIFMTPSAALADIVLPVSTYLEFNDVVVPFYSFPVALVQQKVTSVAECHSDYEILRDLARRLGIGEYFWDTDEQFLDHILTPAGISFEEFKKVGALVGGKQYRSYQSGGFPTPSGKVELYSGQLKEWGFDPLPTYYEAPETPMSAPELLAEYPLVFTSRKDGCYRHSSGRQIASLRGTHPEPIIYLHPQTAGELGIADGDLVCIETERGGIKQRATLSDDIDPMVVVVDYAWWFPEDGAAELYGWSKANINILTGDKPPFNREMGSVNLRGALCKIYKASV